MENFNFSKNERLNSTLLLDKLFSQGENFFLFPFKVVFLKTDFESIFPVQAAFSVPKRNFKKAVDRNLIKRRMKEAYRLQKRPFYQELALIAPSKLLIMFIFVGKEIPDYDVVEKTIKATLKKTVRKLHSRLSS